MITMRPLIMLLCQLPMLMYLYSISYGQDLNKNFLKCFKIGNNLKRLGCYDELAKSLNQKQTIDLLGNTGKWKIKIEKNPLDDSQTILLSLLAERGESKYSKPIGLVLRCKSRQIEAFIAWGTYLGNEARVTSRYGKGKTIKIPWNISSDKMATFWPASISVLLSNLKECATFVAQVTPYNENPITAIFDVRGLREAIKPLTDQCK